MLIGQGRRRNGEGWASSGDTGRGREWVEAATRLAMSRRGRLSALHADVIAQKVSDRWRRGRVVCRARSPPGLLSGHVAGDEISLWCDDEVALAGVVNFALLDQSAQGIVEDVLSWDGDP